MIEDESDGAFLFTHKDGASNPSSHLGSMSARALSLCHIQASNLTNKILSRKSFRQLHQENLLIPVGVIIG